MRRLYLFAEGQTEQTFADTVLKPHLAKFEVYMHNAMLIAHAKKKHRIHRGGGRNFQAMQNDIIRQMKQDRGDDVFFTTMIDLYRIAKDFPGMDRAEKLQHLPYERVRFLEQAWKESTSDARFVPFIVLHEFEALLLADVKHFSFFYDHSESKIAALQSVCDSHKSPELINDGQHTSPSKRIIAQFAEYEKNKTIVGPQAAERIGLSTIRSKCPHFSYWIESLERLGTKE